MVRPSCLTRSSPWSIAVNASAGPPWCRPRTRRCECQRRDRRLARARPHRMRSLALAPNSLSLGCLGPDHSAWATFTEPC